MSPLREFRLECSAFHVNARLRRVNRRWIASADTPDGPSLGLGLTPFQALRNALEPFDGAIGELLASAPREYRFTYWQGQPD